MAVIEVGRLVNDIRVGFFEAIFGQAEGYICIAVAKPDNHAAFNEQFFKYPTELPKILEWINRNYQGRNVYFCPQLLSEKKRKKESVKVCTVVWADLDECDPSVVDPNPPIVLRTSEGRWQGFWPLCEPAEPADAEDVSHRIAYKYEPLGADKSGWDLTQLLRVPKTYNAKYPEGTGLFQVVELIRNDDLCFSLEELREYLPSVPGYEFMDEPFPARLLEWNPADTFELHKDNLPAAIVDMYTSEPEDDWSSVLWKMNNMLLESGLTAEETFVIANNAACNKYARDGRPPEALWKEICKARTRIAAHYEELNRTEMPVLLDPEERDALDAADDTFIEHYIRWANKQSDAASQYHEVGAFMALSSVLAGRVSLKTSFGTIVPNLWVLILADTTLTRKSTAMDMAMDVLQEIEDDIVLATDGSIEGLMHSIAGRPGRPGVFWRDEFSGLLAGMAKRDYMAGMMEAFTKLYDGKYQKRMLRRETIELRDPILNIFAGGIRSKILELIGHEHIISGFVPRFIFVQAESNIKNFKPLGPPVENEQGEREDIVAELAAIKDRYHSEMTMHIGSQTVSTPQVWEAQLTPEAWDRYNRFEFEMVTFGSESNAPEIYTPTMDRLSKSGLKVAILAAAARQTPTGGKVTVDVLDILRAIKYVERWRHHSVDVVENAGKNVSEKRIDIVYKAIARSPGISRGRIMANYHITSKDIEWILDTLEQRGLIRRQRNGKRENIYPAREDDVKAKRARQR